MVLRKSKMATSVSWNWSNGAADKNSLFKGERKFFDSSEEELFRELDQVVHPAVVDERSWVQSGTHQSTFELVIEEEHARRREMKSRAAIYSEELTPIMPIRRKKGRRDGQRKSRNSYGRKFRPLACSTPLSQAPMLTIIETQLSQKQQRAIRRPMDDSQDLLPHIIDSEDQNLIVSVAFPREGRGDELPACEVEQELSLPVVPVSPQRKEGESQNISRSTCRGVSFEFINSNDMLNLIPHILVTSYSNSSKDNVFGDSPVVLGQMYESKRKTFLQRIEGFIYQAICCVNKKGGIHSLILAYENIGGDKRDRELRRSRSKSVIDKKRYGQIFYVLGEVFKLLRTRSNCNKRELYYKNVELFISYNHLCRIVENVCNLLNCAPWELGIVSTSKSLVAGPLKIGNADGEFIDFTEATIEGIPLPNDFHNYHYLQTRAKFVLLVEKETVFKRLINDDIFSRIGYEFLLMTGRGQGDLAIRMCLNRIASQGIPIFGLFDADPYGIEILLTYKCGSVKMMRKSGELTVPSIKWIGVFPSEIEVLNLVRMPLSGTDNKKINDMLRRRYLSEEVAHQLRVAEDGKVKAEIEGLYGLCDNYLIDEYLASKIKTHLSV